MSRSSFQRGIPIVLSAVLLAGCASLTPEQNLNDVQQLTAGRTAGANVTLQRNTREIDAAVAELLKAPLTAESAVRIALLNNPGLHSALAQLDISDAQRVQAGRAPNPHVSVAEYAEGSKLEIERVLRFDVVGLLFLPWKAQWQGQQHELAKLQAAQEVIRLATDTRKAWINAVAAQQTVAYLGQVKEAAEAGAELARRMARVGNWSRLQQAREQVFLADAAAQLARAQQSAMSEREKLTRLMGLWGTQTQFTLAPRLPDLPPQAAELQDMEARALRERLDVRSAVAETGYVANSLGMTKAVGYLNGLTLGYKNASISDNVAGSNDIKHGWELELPLPIFDWGTARNARAQALYMQSATRVRDVAVKARSEAREAYHGWRTAYDLARHYRDEVVPLRKAISDEMLLRYNGMLASVWELLGDMRQQTMSVNNAIEAQRDFWLAEADLQLTLTGTSPGPLTRPRSSGASMASAPQGH
ncbi:MAG: TolC family protein [Pseudomonadota bacterium]|jgi:outer membrane protein TolC|uniref:TolC family protein n=1 Tax=Curvibacter delicatus TaxID=80879 RepID=UPI0008357373|nr:TolC family protein [Curvibacter delicatus]MEA3393379.1 TolC family protein [Pseudomonadota bacterium]